MKVLLINDIHAPTGGAEKYFLDLKARLSALPDMQIFSLGFGKQHVVTSDTRIIKRPLNSFTKLISRFVIDPFLLMQINKHIDTIQPDVIHLHNIKHYSATIYAAVKNYPTVQTVHDFNPICPESQNIHQDLQICQTGFQRSCWWKHRQKTGIISYLSLVAAFYMLRKQMRDAVDFYLTPSPILQQYMIANGFSRTSYLPPFVDIPPASDSPANATPTFLYAGALGKRKGVYQLLDEFALALTIYPNMKLQLAGAGPELADLQKQAASLKIENNVEFLGWQKDIAGYLASCTALIFPSIWMESFGLVMTEAMSHAKPVIGSNRGTSAWLIEDGKTGLHCDPLRYGDLANKILHLARHQDEARQFGLNAREKLISEFNNQTTLSHIVNHYRTVSTSLATSLP